MFVPGRKYKIVARFICNSTCSVPCSSCIIEEEGTYTGRSFTTRDPNKLVYEFQYIKNGKVSHGIFYKEEIEH
jgi:hypothetical protein